MMTNIKSTSRPYAKAAFVAAKASNQLPLWSLALKQLSSAVQDLKMKSILKNPRYTKLQLIELLNSFLRAASGNGSADNHTPIENFIKILSEKKRFNLLPSISELFELDCAKESGYLSLTVTSAFAMDESQKNNTTEKLSKQLNSKCEINFQMDKNLIGGMIVRSGNWVMDGSITGQLAKLRNSLV